MAGSIFSIGNGRHRAVLTLRDEFGVPFRKEFSGTDPKKLKKRMRDFERDYTAGVPTEDMKVEAMCEQAIAACEKRGCAPKTVKGYRDFLRLHIGPTIGAVKIRELQPAHVERMLEKMEERGSSSQTRILCRSFLRMAINRVAVKSGYVVTNAAALADPPKLQHTAQKRLEPADLEAILEAEERPVYRALWLFLASTGLRPGEARTLMWSDFYTQADGQWLKLRQSKTEEGKQPLPVSGAMFEELRKLSKTGLYVFASSTGAPMEEGNIRRAWRYALQRAEVPHTNLYQLRKLFATLQARRVPDAVLKRLMRHTDARTTKQYYVSAIEQDLRAAVES